MIAAGPEHHWPEVLTSLEAAAFLRLIDDHRGDEAAAVRAVGHLVAKHGLNPIRNCGKQNRFTLAELRRWCAQQSSGTEAGQ